MKRLWLLCFLLLSIEIATCQEMSKFPGKILENKALFKERGIKKVVTFEITSNDTLILETMILDSNGNKIQEIHFGKRASAITSLYNYQWNGDFLTKISELNPINKSDTLAEFIYSYQFPSATMLTRRKFGNQTFKKTIRYYNQDSTLRVIKYFSVKDSSMVTELDSFFYDRGNLKFDKFFSGGELLIINYTIKIDEFNVVNYSLHKEGKMEDFSKMKYDKLHNIEEEILSREGGSAIINYEYDRGFLKFKKINNGLDIVTYYYQYF